MADIVRPISRKNDINKRTRKIFLKQFDKVKADPQTKIRITPKPELFPSWQFADTSYNIISSGFACPNDCIYCYMIRFLNSNNSELTSA